MRKFLLVTAVVMTAFTYACAQQDGGIRFENGSLKEVLKTASEQEKLVFVDIYTDWCMPCKKMSDEIFPQKRVGDYVNSRFVSVKINAEKGEGVNIAHLYGVTAYPTFLILDSNGQLLGKMIGGSPAGDFIRQIDGIYKKLVRN